MMDEKKNRFRAHVRMHIADRAFMDSMVIDRAMAGDDADVLIKIGEKEFKQHLNLANFEITDQKLINFVKSLRRDGWSDRRIRNHFSRFNITLPADALIPLVKKVEQPAVSKNQKQLTDFEKKDSNPEPITSVHVNVYNSATGNLVGTNDLHGETISIKSPKKSASKISGTFNQKTGNCSIKKTQEHCKLVDKKPIEKTPYKRKRKKREKRKKRVTKKRPRF